MAKLGLIALFCAFLVRTVIIMGPRIHEENSSKVPISQIVIYLE